MIPESDLRGLLAQGQERLRGGDLVVPDRLKVLMIDDTPEDRMAARLAIESANCSVTEAPNARLGIAMAAESAPDCILLDYSLPDMEGTDVVEQLRCRDGTLPCAIIMLTTRHDAAAASAALKAGVHDFIVKDSFENDSLQRAIRNAVGHFRLIVGKAEAERRNGQLAAIVASSDDAIFSVAVDRRILSWNPAAERIYGYSAAEACGRLVEFLVPDSLQAERATIRRTVLLEGKSMTLETVRLHKQGHLIPLEITISPIFEASGAIRASSVIARDIAERKRIEQALRDTKAQLDLALSASVTGVWDYDLATGEVEWSAEMQAIFGVEQFAGTPDAFAALVHPDDRAAVWRAVEDALAGRKRYECQYRIVRPSGEVRWVASAGRGLYDANGKALRLLGTLTDITARKRTELALLASEHALAERVAELQTLLEVSPVGVALSRDPDCRDVWMNPALQKLQRMDGGARASEISSYGLPFRMMQGGRDVPPDERPMQRACALGEPVLDQEFEIAFPDGSSRVVLKSAVPLFDKDGKVRGCIAFVFDITERKRTEEHLGLLMDELNHRAKNMMSIVQSVARQTAAQSAPQDFMTDLTMRLRALATAQDLLIHGDWQGVPLAELVRSQLGHVGDALEGRVELSGDFAILSPAAAQGIGLAVHELGTNALKYGALSNETGRIRVDWQVPASEEAEFHIRWTETGGPRVANPARKGFGRTVIERMAAHAVNGTVDLRYLPEGVVWKLDAPARNVLVTPIAKAAPQPPQDTDISTDLS